MTRRVPPLLFSYPTVSVGFFELGQKAYGCEGPLLTAGTNIAWQALRIHILKGCLGDPRRIALNIEADAVIIGGIPVEKLHANQKQWLGVFAQ